MKEILKQDKEIIRLLKVEYIAHPIVNTSKGILQLVLRKDEDKHHLTLDAVPLDKEQNDYIIKLLYGTHSLPEEFDSVISLEQNENIQSQ